ncbi:hypothetical protein [Streptomyces sp. NPDC053048]|uniref:hypothetical protein n=1 Tax=Streptomyces sp. NPDC053048 TaxID=3365694 RepID=UPI0037D8A0E3
MAYLEDLAKAKRAGRAWTCSCGADNPAHYDACHDCQTPSWTCAACGTVSPQQQDACIECDCTTASEAIGDREEGFDLTYEEWVTKQIGPRRVGGRYDYGNADSEYEVLAIERGPRPTWPTWQITARGADGQVREHHTGWDARRDRIITEAPADTQGAPDQTQ